MLVPSRTSMRPRDPSIRPTSSRSLGSPHHSVSASSFGHAKADTQ